MDDLGRALEDRILGLLAQRDAGRTICPSDAARSVYGERARPSGSGGDADGGADAGDEGWRELMEPARQAARRLVAEGRLEITQGGEVVDPDRIVGPIRLRLRRPGPA